MHILHTESSNGWGGQEIRILKEAMGLRSSGDSEIFFATTQGAKLASYARKEGFEVFEIDFKRSNALSTLWFLIRLIKKCKIDVVNTHSSWDAWLGGIAARMTGKRVVRTRHLSTPMKGGLNARILYNTLADAVVTTSSGIIPMIQKKASLPSCRIRCIPTGVEPFEVSPAAVEKFRTSLGVKEDEILIGSVCVVRSWKGIQDLIAAASLLKHHPKLKWVVVGGGYLDHFKPLVPSGLPLTFTGHLEDPRPAIAALDIFALLSTAHEGISQASLQAAFLKKPLITTTIGGLPEVCQDGVTGYTVPPSSPQEVARAVMQLVDDDASRKNLGEAGHALVIERHTHLHMLEQMKEVFYEVEGRRR